MKKEQVPAEEVLASIYKGFEHSFARHFSYLSISLEDVFTIYPIFYYCNGVFRFAKRTNSRLADTIGLTPTYFKEDGRLSLGNTTISTYRRVLPFITFTKSMYDEWETDWYKSKELYALLPTRRNIIDKLLIEL